MNTTANPLVARSAAESPSPRAGVWIAEDIEQIATGVKNGDWISGTLGTFGGGLDALALVSDPVGALLQYGIAWLIEHVKPLSEALDWLAGDPARIAAQAQTWRNVAASLVADADAVGRAAAGDTIDWTGTAGDTYRAWAGRREQSLRSLATSADTMAMMTEGAGLLIGSVRLMVRDAVATVVSRLIVYAGELIATLGGAAGFVVEQVSTLCAAWAAKISGWLRDLLASMRRLMAAADDLAQRIRALIDRRRNAEAPEPAPSASPGPPRDPKEEAERRRKLGFDPGQRRHLPAEEETAIRLEQELGIELTRSEDSALDWVGSDGYTYDAVGNFEPRFFDRQWSNLQRQILDHVRKADRVPVDVSRFTPEQKELVRDFLRDRELGPQAFLLGE